MSTLHNYFNDGANAQAKSVLMLLQDLLPEDNTTHFQISRWHNCREQGYILSVRPIELNLRQLNVIWFQHRNSDQIHCVH